MRHEIKSGVIEWENRRQTASTMVKEGRYSPRVTQEEVRRAVDGQFGGRFELFHEGRFRFVAYTD